MQWPPTWSEPHDLLKARAEETRLPPLRHHLRTRLPSGTQATRATAFTVRPGLAATTPSATNAKPGPRRACRRRANALRPGSCVWSPKRSTAQRRQQHECDRGLRLKVGPPLAERASPGAAAAVCCWPAGRVTLHRRRACSSTLEGAASRRLVRWLRGLRSRPRARGHPAWYARRQQLAIWLRGGAVAEAIGLA
jgi:hypothetical protein